MGIGKGTLGRRYENALFRGVPGSKKGGGGGLKIKRDKKKKVPIPVSFRLGDGEKKMVK